MLKGKAGEVVQAVALKAGYMIVPQCNGILPPGHQGVLSEDGLYTQHNVDFLNDKRFMEADAAGLAAQSKSGFEHGCKYRMQIAIKLAGFAKHLGGAYIECGTWYGRTMRTLLEYHDGLSGHEIYLIDTFSGFIKDDLTDTELSRRHQGELEAYYSNSPDGWLSAVKETFDPFPNVHIIKGAVPDVLYHGPTLPNEVAFLHIDMNSAAAEYEADKYFWNRLVPGAIVLLDDYAYANLGEQKRAHDMFAGQVGIEIMPLPTGQGLYIKVV